MRAQLDILKLSMSDDPETPGKLMSLQTMWNVTRIIGQDRLREHDLPRAMTRYAGSEAEITLRLARADALIRIATRLPAKARYTGGDPASALAEAMAELIRIEQWASPSETPGRFRQIATRFLDAYGKAVALQDKRPGATDLNYPVMDRKAAYFRTMLPLLTTIGEARAPN
jgi:hypothetical protein